jgi:WD40 repeat protein
MRPVWVLFAVILVPAVRAGEPLRVKPLGTLPAELDDVYYTPIAFSPDGKALAVSHADEGSVKLWDVKQRKVIATFPGRALSLALSPDGKTLAVGGDHKTVTLWDVPTGKKRGSLLSEGGFSCVVLSPDGKTLATGEGRVGEHKGAMVRLWELSTGKERASLKGHEGPILTLAFSPDGRLLATGSGRFASNGQPGDGEVKLWEVATGRERATLKGGLQLKLRDKGLTLLREDGVPEAVLKTLASWKDREFRTEEELDRELSRLLGKIPDRDKREEHRGLVLMQAEPAYNGPGVVWSVAFSPDGKTLASGDVFGWVLLWDVKSGKRRATLQSFNPEGREEDIHGALSVAFSPDGKTLAAGITCGLKFWDVTSGKQVAARKGAPVWSVAFRPDGKALATAESNRGTARDASKDGVIRLWELVPSRKAGR